MHKSLQIQLSEYFEPTPYGTKKARMPIQDATRTAYGHTQTDAYVIEQEFDGKYGYLYSYEWQLDQSITLPIRIDFADLHVLYMMDGRDNLQLQDGSGTLICNIAPSRARYMYLPAGMYQLVVSAGYTQLFGYYFDGALFRNGTERPFAFLHPLIDAYRQQLSVAVVSVDFKVGILTQLHIEHLCSCLRKDLLDNEAFILGELTKLITLSKQKITDEYTIVPAAVALAQLAGEIIVRWVDERGIAFSIQEVAAVLERSPAHLSQIFKEQYACTAQQYKDKCLLHRIENELRTATRISDIAISCNFSSIAAFSRYVKMHKGVSPVLLKEYLK